MKQAKKQGMKQNIKQSLKIVPLGGLGEFGKNCLLLEYGANYLLIDFGLKFSALKQYGVDYEIPDINYLYNNKSRLGGIIITHAHLDHIGGLPYLLERLKIPIYASPFSASIIKRIFKSNHRPIPNVKPIEQGRSFTIGAFEIEPIAVDHSIPETFAFAVQTPGGCIIHSGDFRNDKQPYATAKTDIKKFQKYGNKKVLALFSDSTNAASLGKHVPEQLVYKNIEKIFKNNKKNRIIFSTFSTQISRLKKILDLARKYKRSVFLTGRAMNENTKAALENNFLGNSDKLLLSLKAFRSKKPKDVVVIATGSQGESNSSMIKISRREHGQVDLLKEDVIVLSSSTIPGNEKQVETLLENFAYNDNVIITNDDLDIHSSGHGYRKELEDLLKAVKPMYFFPIHGNYLNMRRHKQIAMELGLSEKNIFIIENGQKVEISPRNVQYLERLRLKNFYVVNNKLADVKKESIGEREILSRSGIIFIHVLLNGGSLRDVYLHSSGVTLEKEHDFIEMKRILQKAVGSLVQQGSLPSASKIQKHVQREVERFIKRSGFYLPKISSEVSFL